MHSVSSPCPANVATLSRSGAGRVSSQSIGSVRGLLPVVNFAARWASLSSSSTSSSCPASPSSPNVATTSGLRFRDGPFENEFDRYFPTQLDVDGNPVFAFPPSYNAAQLLQLKCTTGSKRARISRTTSDTTDGSVNPSTLAFNTPHLN